MTVPALPASAAPAAAPAAGAAKAAAADGKSLLTQGQALAQARKTGKAVQVSGATTDSSTLTANPDGTLTLDETNMPVRKDVGGTWEPLNATLHRNADGSISPAVSADPLTLSGGGTGALASMTSQGHTLSLTLPWKLPAPTLSGPTATYAGVPAPGIDLQVTADSQGGFTDVLVVKNATAARSPALRSFSFRPSVTGGLILKTDSHGNLLASSRSGHAFFEIPAAVMWDSRTPAAGTVKTAVDPAVGRDVDLRDGQPVASAASSPGEDARTAAVGTRLHGGALTYTPSQTVLAGKGTVYPVYIDPAAGSVEQYWSQVDSAFPSQTYPKPNPMQVGDNDWQAPYFVARSFVRESVPSTLDGAATDVESATLYLTDEYAPACDSGQGNFGVQVWTTGAISSGTDWSNQPAWDTDEASKSFAHGYDSSCPAASEGFTVTGAMTTAAHNSSASVTFGIRAASESDGYGWKQFSDTVTLSTTYDKAPNKPGDLKTSPATSCTASTPTTVGDGDVTLYATMSDPLGSNAGSLTADVYVTDDATHKAISGSPFKFTGLGNGSLVTKLLTESVLKGLAGTTVTKFSWYATVTDGTLTSPDSTTCNFDYDPASPGAPSVCPQAGCNTQPPPTYQVGTIASFDVTPNAMGVTPTSYTYQVNGAAPQTRAADASGDATISVTPLSGADALTVTAVSAGGNIGQSATVFFTAGPQGNATDGDMTGDHVPDLVTPGGGSTGLAPGLWLAEGQAAPGGNTGDGQVIASATDIGAEGDGIAGDYSPDDFTGSQVITGLFSDNGFQDSLIYFPPGSGNYATGGVILDGTGDGTIRDDQDMYASGDSALTTQIPSGSLADPNGDNPLQLANGYNSDPGDNTDYADLIAVNGDSTNGYYLGYYQNASIPGSWLPPDILSAETPDGTMDWNDWQITTMQDPAGYADMFLYDPSTRALYLWQDFTVDDSDDTAGYTQYELSADWAPGTLSELRAANITGTGPALWAVTNSGTVTAWITSSLNAAAGTGSISAQPAQSLLSPTHAWHLGDGTSGSATAAADTGGGTSLPLTGNSGVTWTTGDLFDPDATFNGTSGYMTTSSQVLNTTGNWSVSAWVKPAALGGIVLSQYGTEASCMRISIATTTTGSVTTGSWRLATTNADSATATSVLATAGDTYNVQVGTWTHLTATYDASAGFLRLYVDGVPAASASTTAVWSSGCSTFALGQWKTGGGTGGYFNGQISDVQTWNGTAVSPTQAAVLSGTPGYTLFPSDSTQYTSASSATDWQWTTAAAKMDFYQGFINILDTGTKTTTTSIGATGTAAAVLTLQTDGNLVIYPNAAAADAANGNALWKSSTGGDTGDVMFFQPDGNLVIYGSYGQVLWASNTAN